MSTADAELGIADSLVRADFPALTRAREARVGDMTVRRLLPLRQRRSAGAWCFADHYGPMSVDGVAGMRVPPHPHIGLQTVTWLGAGGLEVTVFIGSLPGAQSPATVFSEIVGAQIVARGDAAGRGAAGRIPLAAAHEHVMFVSAGSAEVEGTVLGTGQLLYLGTGRDQVTVAAAAGSSFFLLGGVPLGEPLLMWWNFVARTPEEITAAASEWAKGRFGTVNGYRGEPLPAPPLDAARLRRRP